MVFLSIVIPCYNAEKTIISLLDSISRSQKTNPEEIELVVVDDKSSDSTLQLVTDYVKEEAPSLKKAQGTWRIISLTKNSGPARARNIGVKYATGKIILFLDSDVEVYSNTLFEVIRSFRGDPDLYALTGVWDKTQKSRHFFPKFKAMRDWSYWINERDPRNYYYLFSTRVAAIDRSLFLRLGGFDESYKTALVEDIDLTYRIARRYAVVFNPNVKVRHEFENFLPIARKYFWRSYYWSRIYRSRKKFDPVATTWKEAITTLSAGGIVMVFPLSYLSYLSNLKAITTGLIIISAVLLFIHLWGVRKFLWFCLKEEGILFAVGAFLTGIVLYGVILCGAILSFVKR